MQKPKLVIVVGATASGKTGLAVKLAKQFNGEVISADSRQVYRKLDIGTAKTTPEEMDGVPHHLIDIVDIDTVYNATDFAHDAALAIDSITSRHHLPIIAGGTFFYIDTLLGRITTPEVKPNPALRTHLEALSTKILFAQLEKLDPDRALSVDKDNKRRLIRALEIIDSLGTVPKPAAVECPYDVLTIGIEVDKTTLRSKYESRACEWLAGGFQKEVEDLLATGVSRARLHEIGFEYQLMLALIDDKIDKKEFVQRFIEKNWQYAKRQIAWLRRDSTIYWYERTEETHILHHVKKFLLDSTD